MTPDDIRHATFDRVRKGIDPEQVRDLLARVAFLLEKTPGIDLDALDSEGALPAQTPLIDLEERIDAGAAVVPPTTIREPVVDHRLLADTLGSVIAATEQLVEWKAELERTAEPVEVCVSDPQPPAFEIRGVDGLRHRLMQQPLPLARDELDVAEHRVHA